MQARRVSPLVAALLLGFLAWSPTVWTGGFSYDDREVLEDNPVVAGTLPLSAAFDRDYWHHRGDAGHWRPLATLSLRLDFAMWTGAAGYHATNVLLHLGAVLLLGLLLRELRPADERLLWPGLALFAVHPALADSVAWISGRTSMLSAIGGLVGALGIARSRASVRASHWRAGACAGLGLALALMGKEDGLAFAPLFVLLAARRSRAHALAAALGSAAAVALWLAARKVALGVALPAAPWAPLGAAPLLERLHASGKAILEMLRIAVFPVGYAPSYDAGDLPPVGAAARVAGVLGWSLLALALGAGLAGLRGAAPGRRIASGSLLLAAAAVLPHAQLVPSGEVLAPRFLYLPLLFGAPFADALAPRRGRGRGRAVALALLLACVPLAWASARTYASRASFWRAVLAASPHDARAWHGLGMAHWEAGERAQAEEAWQRALELRPAYSRPLSMLAAARMEAGRLDEAEPLFARAVALGPENAVARANYGKLLLELHRVDEALAMYARAAQLEPGRGAIWRGLGAALSAAGDEERARAAFQRALELDPADDLARKHLSRLPAPDPPR